MCKIGPSRKYFHMRFEGKSKSEAIFVTVEVSSEIMICQCLHTVTVVGLCIQVSIHLLDGQKSQVVGQQRWWQ